MKKLNSLTKKAAFLAVAASLILIESGHAASIPNCGVNVYALSNAGSLQELQLPKQLSFLFLVCLPVQIYFEPCRPTLARH